MTSMLALGLIFALPLLLLVGSDDDPAQDAETPPTPPEPDSDPLGTDGSDLFNNGDDSTGRFYDLMGGNDEVIAGAGNDTITNGTGFARINAGAGDDLIDAGDGVIAVLDSEGDDTILGGAGNDSVTDTEGNNRIDGGEGVDVISAGGSSTISGGAGIDVFSLSLDADAESPLVITDFLSGTDRLEDLRLRISGEQAGQIRFEERTDGLGANILFNDNLIAEVMGASVADLETFDANQWSLQDGAVFTSTDPAAQDTILGSQGADVIDGGAGDDWITGNRNYGAAGDLLQGGAGNDTILGHGITDRGAAEGVGVGFITEQSTLHGGAGDDLLISSDSNVLTGGQGQDVFRISVTDDVSIELPPASEITDFVQGDDTLMILTNRVLDQADVTILPWSDGLGADVMNGDSVLVRITGGQNLTLADLVFMRS